MQLYYEHFQYVPNYGSWMGSGTCFIWSTIVIIKAIISSFKIWVLMQTYKEDTNLHIGVNERCFTFDHRLRLICKPWLGLHIWVMGQMLLHHIASGLIWGKKRRTNGLSKVWWVVHLEREIYALNWWIKWACLIWLFIPNAHLYLSGVWSGVDLRTTTITTWLRASEEEGLCFEGNHCLPNPRTSPQVPNGYGDIRPTMCLMLWFHFRWDIHGCHP